MNPYKSAILILLINATTSSVWEHNAQAYSYQSLLLGGVAWRVPTEFIDNQSPLTSNLHTLSLRFELPDFRPVNLKDFSGVYTRDDLPVLAVKLSDNATGSAGQSLLESYINEALKDCPTCTVDPSSVGGTEYATFTGLIGPAPHSPDGILFRLYEYPKSGGQFAVCNFAPDLAPLPCEMIEKINGKTEAILSFPIEYVTQGPELLQEFNRKLNSYRAGRQAEKLRDIYVDNLNMTCWAPVTGSSGAKTVAIEIGPETWHIPEAYASTFGLDQTNDPKHDSISFWLKLPNLEPLSSSDPSPIEIRGPGNYISVMISYDGRHISPQSRNSFLAELRPVSNYIGKNAFINFDEYQEANSPEALSYLYIDQLDFISNNPNSADGSFPPDWFTCIQPGGAPSPLCRFGLNEYLKAASLSGNNPGHYFIEYDFSRDYFAQILGISHCVENLYREFRFGALP